jgi:hypothetical protein
MAITMGSLKCLLPRNRSGIKVKKIMNFSPPSYMDQTTSDNLIDLAP